MRLLIDVQGAQGASKGRGIGRFTLSLAKALIEHRGAHEVSLLVSGMAGAGATEIKEVFRELLPADALVEWQARGPVAASLVNTDLDRQEAVRARELAISRVGADAVLIPSFFEGFLDNGVTSIGGAAHGVPTAVVMLDLIPWIHQDTYLSDFRHRNWYLGKFEALRAADCLLAISESSRREAITCLGFSDDEVINISAACDERFQPLVPGGSDAAELLAKLGITKPFLFYLGADDPRKNCARLVGAFARLPDHLRREYQLVIAGSGIGGGMGPQLHAEEARLGLPKGSLVTLSRVDDALLALLYGQCRLFVFPSWHEGFGLPVLEAMRCGAPVIASNVSSLPEIVGVREALFDPYDEQAIACGIEAVLANPAFREALVQHGLRRSGDFTWERVANSAWRAIEILLARRGGIAAPKTESPSEQRAGSGQADLANLLESVETQRVVWRKVQDGQAESLARAQDWARGAETYAKSLAEGMQHLRSAASEERSSWAVERDSLIAAVARLEVWAKGADAYAKSLSDALLKLRHPAAAGGSPGAERGSTDPYGELLARFKDADAYAHSLSEERAKFREAMREERAAMSRERDALLAVLRRLEDWARRSEAYAQSLEAENKKIALALQLEREAWAVAQLARDDSTRLLELRCRQLEAVARDATERVPGLRRAFARERTAIEVERQTHQSAQESAARRVRELEDTIGDMALRHAGLIAAHEQERTAWQDERQRLATEAVPFRRWWVGARAYLWWSGARRLWRG